MTAVLSSTNALAEVVERRARGTDLRVVAGFDDIAAGWDELASLAPSPMQAVTWARAAAEPQAPVATLVLGDLRRPDAIAPLAGAGRRSVGVTPAAFGEPIDLLFRDRAALSALCSGLAALRLPVELTRLSADSPTVDEVASSYSKKGLVVRRATNPYPAVRLDPSWAEPESHFNSGRRSDLRRARRRADALGAVEFDLRSPGPDEVEALMDEAIGIEARGWKGRAGTALAADPAQARFFRRWAALAAADGTLRLAFLRVGGRAVAMQLAAEVGGRLWLFKIGYDEEVARCSPGNLLMLEVVRAAVARGCESVEFLGRSEPWTEVWADVNRPCAGVVAYPVGISGASALIRSVVARSRERLRASRDDATQEG